MKLHFIKQANDRYYELYVDDLTLDIIYPSTKLLETANSFALNKKNYPSIYLLQFSDEVEAVGAVYDQLISRLPFYALNPDRTRFEITLAIQELTLNE